MAASSSPSSSPSSSSSSCFFFCKESEATKLFSSLMGGHRSFPPPGFGIFPVSRNETARIARIGEGTTDDKEISLSKGNDDEKRKQGRKAVPEGGLSAVSQRAESEFANSGTLTRSGREPRSVSFEKLVYLSATSAAPLVCVEIGPIPAAATCARSRRYSLQDHAV